MQAMLLIAIFSLFLSVVGGIIVSSGPGTAQLTRMRTAQTQEYFRAIEIASNELTRNNLQMTPPAVDDMRAYIRNTPDLAQLSSGRWENPTLDAWGNDLTILRARENRVIYSNGAEQVVAPVTAIALISPGPNRTLETAIPGAVSIASLQGVLPPAGSDDIVHAFTDEATQRATWASINRRLERIAAAELRYYQHQVGDYRENLMQRYLQELRNDAVTNPPNVADIMANDPNAPRFLDLNSDNNRRFLGVDEDFNYIERTVNGTGRFLVATALNPDRTLSLRVVNDPSAPTAWGNPPASLSYTMILKGTL